MVHIRQMIVIFFVMVLTALLAACGPQETAHLPVSETPTSAARVPPPTTGSVLPGTKWVLTSLLGQPLLPDTTINLEFGEAWYSGYTGCNNYGGGPDSGKYTATDEGTLKIIGMAVTVQLCPTPAGVMEQEQTYIAAFASIATYRLNEDRLELQDATGETILVYARQPECAEPPADLAGTGWQLVSVDGQEPVESSATTLAFLDDQWLVEYSKCEAYIKAYHTAGHDLDLVFEAWLGRTCQDEGGQGATLLGSPSETCLVQGRLQITTVPGQVFVYEPLPEAAQPPLEGPTWTLLAAVEERRPEGLPVPVPDPNPVLEETEITLRFEGSTATGSAGCNAYGAAYTLDGTSLTFGEVAATEKDCVAPEGIMEQEQRYLTWLQDVTGYHIYGRQLWLMVGDGQALIFSVKA